MHHHSRPSWAAGRGQAPPLHEPVSALGQLGYAVSTATTVTGQAGTPTTDQRMLGCYGVQVHLPHLIYKEESFLCAILFSL